MNMHPVNMHPAESDPSTFSPDSQLPDPQLPQEERFELVPSEWLNWYDTSGHLTPEEMDRILDEVHGPSEYAPWRLGRRRVVPPARLPNGRVVAGSPGWPVALGWLFDPPFVPIDIDVLFADSDQHRR